MVLALAAGCASHGAEPELAAYVPAGAEIVAGAHIAAVRRSPMYADFPAVVKDFIEPVGGASEMVAAMGDFGLLTLARGKFPAAPAGFTLMRRGIVASGPADRRASNSNAELLRDAPVKSDVWIAALGKATLPLTGNLANLNRFLHLTDRMTAGAIFSDHVEMQIVAFCRDADRATVLDQTLRAFASLASAAGRHTGEVTIRTDNRDVRIAINMSRDDFARLLEKIGR